LHQSYLEMKKQFHTLLLLFISSLMLSQQKIHTVLAKETLYGLSKKYNVSIDDLKKVNPQLNNRTLQIGEILIIPDEKARSKANEYSNSNATTNTQNSDDAQNINYFFITIEPKQTLYGLSKKYHTSIKTIQSLNPNMSKEGPKIGEVLKIPKNSSSENSNTYSHVYSENKHDKENSNINDSNSKEEINVKDKREFDLANDTKLQNSKNENFENQNNQEIDDLNKKQSDENVQIPVAKNQTENIANYEFKKDGINVVLFLPLHTGESSINAERRIATQFYSGARTALDSLSNKGKKIHVKIFDTSNDNKFREIIDTYDFSNTNLIIGPLFKSNLLTIADKIKKIPIISPFSSSDDLDEHENLILYNTKDQILVEKLTDEILKKYSGEKMYILYDEEHFKTAEFLQSLIKDKKSNAEVVLTKNADDIKSDQNLVTDEYNKIYAILISTQNSIITKYLDSITKLESNQIQPVSLFYSPLFDNKKYEEKLLNFGLLYLDTNYVNEFGFNEQKMINLYRKKYCNFPDKYAITGFDVTYDILSRVDEKGNLSNSMMKAESKQVSNKYSFRKINKNGAWVNQEARIIQLLK
jgi:peptidoglycan DL-endopeptidase LytF